MVEFGVCPDCALILPANLFSKSSLFSCSVEDPVKAMMLLFVSCQCMNRLANNCKLSSDYYYLE